MRTGNAERSTICANCAFLLMFEGHVTQKTMVDLNERNHDQYFDIVSKLFKAANPIFRETDVVSSLR